MMNKFKVDKLKIKNFRGFKEETIFEFDNDCNAIIISGMNGIGKTSLYDAMEWLFTGELVRYSYPSEERNCKFIRFQPLDNNEATEVSAIVKNDLTNFIVTRELIDQTVNVCDYGIGKTKLKVIDSNGLEILGDDASTFIDRMLINKSWQGKIKFSDVFGQYHLLSQDKIKYFVQGIKMPERYEYFANLLGNDRYLKNIPYLERNISNMRKKNKEIERNIIDIEKLLLQYQNINITDKSFNIHDVNDLKDKILQCTTILNNYSKMYNIDIQFVVNSISNENIKLILEESSNLYSKIESIKNKFKENIDNLREIESGYKIYHENLIKSKNMQCFIDINDKLKKLEYIKDNIEIFIEFENDRVNLLKVKDEMLNEQEIYKCKLTSVRNIYTNISNFIEDIKDKDKDKINIDNLIEYIKNNTLKFDDNGFYIDRKDKKLGILKCSEYKEPSLLELDYNIFKNNIIGNLNNLEKEYIRLSELDEKYKEDEEYVKSNIKNLSDTDISIKTVLIDAKEYISNSNAKNCPICENNIDCTEIIKRITERLNTPNTYIENETISLKKIQAKRKDINESINDFYMETKSILNEYIKYIDNIIKSIYKLGIELKNEYDLTKNNYKKTDSELSDLQEKNHKYAQYIRELKINPESIELDIDNLTNRLDDEQKHIPYDYTNNNIEDIIKLKYRVDLSIEIYCNKLKKECIDMANIEKYIKDKINVEEENLIKANKSLSDISEVKAKVNNIYINLKVNDDYNKWEEYNNELEKLKFSLEHNNKKIFNMEKIKENISEVVASLNKEVMEGNKNIINSIFKKIFPNPYYKSIDFNFDTFRNKNILKLECRHQDGSTKINPAYIFSSTQVNIISVSVFIGIAMKQTCTNLDLILLDDPIQNMDDMNVLSFIDVLRGCMNPEILNKQIILSTHDNKTASLFIKKFRFYKGKNYKFVEYSNAGPVIECKTFGVIR